MWILLVYAPIWELFSLKHQKWADLGILRWILRGDVLLLASMNVSWTAIVHVFWCDIYEKIAPRYAGCWSQIKTLHILDLVLTNVKKRKAITVKCLCWTFIKLHIIWNKVCGCPCISMLWSLWNLIKRGAVHNHSSRKLQVKSTVMEVAFASMDVNVVQSIILFFLPLLRDWV